ncbi:MAG: bifunctional riboflavin kinase/FAD synthetase [Clostridiaceae bacterium]|nr:bifunctional riboflavin kinase/FAD synthetase [Clostridiaceae bacterium]
MKDTIIALGFFDGVHLGHQRILSTAADEAEKKGLTSMAVTFENQPRAFLNKTSPNLLTTKEQREEYIRLQGIKRVEMLPFDKAMAGMSPEVFVRDILVDRYGCRAVVCGENYSFGSMGRGDGKLLRELGSGLGFECHICPPVVKDGLTVSSSWIRSLVGEGRIKEAGELLGRRYSIRGEIAHGRGVGAKLGFPTGNIAIPKDMLAPKYGVYAGVMKIGEISFMCAVNIGIRPTFGLKTPVLEFHVLDFEGDIYGRTAEISLVDFVREERAFASAKELAEQIACDVGLIKELLR